MKKYSLALFCILALSACDSSSTDPILAEDGSGGGGDTDIGDGGDDSDTGTGDGDDDGDTGIGDGGDDGDTSTCAAPTLGNIIDQGSTVLTDGCIDGDVVDLSAGTTSSRPYSLFDGVFNFGDAESADFPTDVKGLYLYTQGSAPGYVVPYIMNGYYNRAGSLGFVTQGPGVYYLPFSRESSPAGVDLNGLGLVVSSATSGAVNLTEVTWAHVDDDVTGVAKLHWQDSSIPDVVGGYYGRNLITLAASGHPLRAMTHILSEDVVEQYKALVEGICPTFDGSFSELPAVRFIDATGELGQAWTGRDVTIRSADDFTRPIYMIAIDWTYATNAIVEEVLTSIESQSFLWPDPQHPSMQDGSCDPELVVSTNFDDLRQQVLDGTIGSPADWSH